MSSTNAFNLNQSKILFSGNVLKSQDLPVITEMPNLCTSVGSTQDSRTGGLRGLMTVISTQFIPLSPPSFVSTTVMWASSQ